MSDVRILINLELRVLIFLLYLVAYFYHRNSYLLKNLYTLYVKIFLYNMNLILTNFYCMTLYPTSQEILSHHQFLRFLQLVALIEIQEKH